MERRGTERGLEVHERTETGREMKGRDGKESKREGSEGEGRDRTVEEIKTGKK